MRRFVCLFFFFSHAIVSEDKQDANNKMTSTFAQSGNRYVPDQWLMTFPDGTKAVFSISTDWGVAVSVTSGVDDLSKYVSVAWIRMSE